MTTDAITLRLPRPEAELLYAQLSDLADAIRDEAEDEHDERIGEVLDGIADRIHTALRTEKPRDAC